MKITWKLAPDGRGGWAGVIELPINPGAVEGGGRVVAMAKGADKATALGKAAVIAEQVLSNPVVASLLPPGTPLAIGAIKELSKAAAVGKLADVAKKFTGPAMDRLKKVLPW